MLTTFDYLLVAGLLLALLLARRRSGSSRQGAVAGAGAAVAAVDSSALWCWWSRHRDVVLALHNPLPRTLLHCATYAILPRHQWALSGFAPYTRAVVTRPMVDAVFVFFYNVFVPRLLSELPLRQQVLVAVLYTLLPMGFWYLQDTAAQLGISVRQQRGGRVGASARRGDRRSTPQHEQEHTEKSPVQQNVSSLTAKPRRLQITQQRPGDNANTGDGVVGSGSTSWPASEATRVDQAHSSIGASPPPVQSHPGSFERYSRRVLDAAPAIAAAAAASGESLLPTNDKRGGDSGIGAPYVGQAVVVRGCVQLIMWTRTPVAAADGAVSAPEQPQQPPLDARLLSQLLPDGDQVGGLAVQQQQQQQAAVAAAAGGSVAIQLLHLTPPVLPLPGGPTASDATAPPPEPLRLRLFSPAPQRARLLVVGSSSTEAAAAATAAGGLRPQRVFAELQVQLCGGDQELELGGEVLRQLLLMECVEAEAPTGCGRALQLLLLPPVHDGDEELVEAAEGSAGEGMPPPPLLHFSAPLLVLPAAAAVELCGLWEQVAAEVGGDAAAAHAHLQPLLSDLAYVLEAAETEELPAAAEGADSDAAADAELGFAMASADLMSYFLRAGLPAAAALLRRPAPSLEAQFRGWRALRLADTAPYLLLVTALPYVMASVRSALQGYSAMTSMNILNALEWASDVLALVGLMALVRRRQRLQQRRHAAAMAVVATAEAAPQESAGGGPAAGSSGCSSTSTANNAPKAANDAVPQPAGSEQQQGEAVCGSSCHGGAAAAAGAALDVAGLSAAYAAYEALHTYIAPLVLFATLLLTRLGVLTFNPAYIGNAKVTAALVIYRGAFRPVARILALVACERAAAAVTSGACELRARGRFLQQQQWQQQQQRAERIATSSGVAEMKVKDV
eukprot:XP_001690574.1 predicted protein [Chlamydomonas reinhardtii]